MRPSSGCVLHLYPEIKIRHAEIQTNRIQMKNSHILIIFAHINVLLDRIYSRSNKFPSRHGLGSSMAQWVHFAIVLQRDSFLGKELQYRVHQTPKQIQLTTGSQHISLPIVQVIIYHLTIE